MLNSFAKDNGDILYLLSFIMYKLQLFSNSDSELNLGESEFSNSRTQTAQLLFLQAEGLL